MYYRVKPKRGLLIEEYWTIIQGHRFESCILNETSQRLLAFYFVKRDEVTLCTLWILFVIKMTSRQ